MSEPGTPLPRTLVEVHGLVLVAQGASACLDTGVLYVFALLPGVGIPREVVFDTPATLVGGFH